MYINFIILIKGVAIRTILYVINIVLIYILMGTIFLVLLVNLNQGTEKQYVGIRFFSFIMIVIIYF